MAADVRDEVFEQLLRWCADLHDTTSGRTEAVHAIDILAAALTDDQRARACRTLLALSDQPGMNPIDTMNLASLDPLSRFRFDSGADHFAAECLRVATSCATTDDELDQSEKRLFTALARGSTDPYDAHLRARTALTLDARRPVPLDGLAAHPAARVRQAAARCWAHRTRHTTDTPRALELAAQLASQLAGDSDPSVRGHVAAALAALAHRQPELPTSLETALDTLRRDPHARVRRPAHSTSTGGDQVAATPPAPPA